MYLCQRPDLLERMAAGDQVLVPTLSCFYGVAGLGEPTPLTWAPEPPPPATWSPLLVELAHYNLEQADRTLRAAKAAGVRIAAGHDWHPFWDLATEIRRMIDHGLTAAEALSAATAGAAHALGIDAHVGTIAPGKVADLAVFDGDPLAEPELLSRRDAVWLVIQRGTAVAGVALERAAGDLAS
jgi:imidazolonepropionase-like amidohydrolase